MDLERREDDTTRTRVDDALELAALAAARQAARKTAARAAGGYFALLLVLFVGAIAWQQSTNSRLDRSERRACERLQVQRERANVGEARDYLLMVAITEAPRASAVVRDEYSGLARTAAFDPPTDCPAAVQHPNSYRRPPSVPYCTADGRSCDALSKDFARAVVQAAKQKRPQPRPKG